MCIRDRNTTIRIRNPFLDKYEGAIPFTEDASGPQRGCEASFFIDKRNFFPDKDVSQMGKMGYNQNSKTIYQREEHNT